MRRLLPTLALALLGLLAGLGLSQCFSPTYADCAFRCGTGTPSCPAEYECRPDGYCHLPASTATCGPALDLGAAGDLGTDSAPAD